MAQSNSISRSEYVDFFSFWPRYLAGITLLLTGMYLLTTSAELLSISVAMLFFFFLFAGRSHWLQFGRTGGLANTITGLRTLGILLLLFFQQYFHPYIFFVAGILILVADGLDGYYARKYKTVSEFGDFFDKETDAFFVLAFCVILIEQQLLGLWVIFPALLRYAFVLILYLCKIEHIVLKKSFRRRFVGMWFMGTIMGCFVLPEVVYTTAMVFASAMLFYSFLKDFYLMLRERNYQG